MFAARKTGEDFCAFGSSSASAKGAQIGTGPAGTRGLEVLVVAVVQAIHMRQWYTTTKELQLVSLELCEACRCAYTLHLRVDGGIPTTLLAAVVRAPRAKSEGGLPSRVPPLGARRVTWELPSLDLLGNPMYALSEVEELYFGDAFNGSLEIRAWPSRLRKIEFGAQSRFNQPVAPVAWLVSLQELTFGLYFNQPIEGITWPASLKQLKFGDAFNQPIEGVTWPMSLRQLRFGRNFNQPVEGVTWPMLVQELEFSGDFNQPIEGVKWPASLRQLVLGSHFDQPVGSVNWPMLLRELEFSNDFNRPIEGVTWPASLRQLVLVRHFNHSIERVKWPMSLRRMIFGGDFNQPIDGVAWPTRLQELTFEGSFNQPIEGVAWPPSLEELKFGLHFNQPIEEIKCPSLRRFTLSGNFSKPLRKLGTAFPALEQFTLHFWCSPTGYDLLRYIEWPAGLTRLTVDRYAPLVGLQIPPGVSIVCRHVWRW